MKLWLMSLAAASLVTACGGDSGDKQLKPQPNRSPDQPRIYDDGVPVETFLVGGRGLPKRVKSQTLVLQFRSNFPDASFQCARDRDDYKPCKDGDSFTFDTLIHGRGYSLKVRARTQDGRIDRSPLSFDFLADQVSGQIPFSAPSDAAQVDPDKMPVALESMGKPDDDDVLENRSLQVGGYTGVVIPDKMTVTSYSTTKTYAGVLRMIRLLGTHGGSAYQNIPCTQEWESPLMLSNGRSYCDSRPTREQLRLTLPAHMPWNHLEMVTGNGPDTDEKILVAAFDDEPDQTEDMLGIRYICQGSRTSGRSRVPILNTFYDVEPEREMFSWCQTKDEHGDYWWLGTFAAPLKKGPGDSPRIRVIYSIAAKRGIISGAQFSSHVGSIMTKIVVPLTAIE